MPEENMWASFFDTEQIFSELQISSDINDLAEIGCGYGTFTIPAARLIRGNLYAFDIEKEMLDIVRKKLTTLHIENVIPAERDILSHTTGLASSSVDYVMLFNILHNESPVDFLNEAYRILKHSGKIGILHWRSDIKTPRGPDLSIRPKPDQILQWVDKIKFRIDKEPIVIEQYHYGMIISKL